MAANSSENRPRGTHRRRAGGASAGARVRPSGSGSAPRRWLAAAVLLGAVGLLYHELAFEGKVFFASDNQAASSFASVGNEQLASGSYPVWNPYLFSGMPSYGSLAYTPRVYPVGVVIGFLVRYLYFPEYSWLLLHTLLAGLGTYLLVRSRGAHAGAALAAGVFMMWMPNLVAIGANGHGSQACAVAYMPFALYFWDRLWRGRGVLENGAALSIVLGLSMLRGHLQISYYTYALVGLHALFFGAARIVDAARKRDAAESPLPARWRTRLEASGTPPMRRALADTGFALGALAVVIAFSLAMCAVLYLPVHDYASHSIRGASSAGGLDYGYATSWSLHPAEMLTFLVPHAFGFGKELYLGHMPFTDYPNYLGVVVLAFATVALAGARSRWVGFAAFVAAAATLVSFGKYFPVVYDPLFKYLPYFSKFRVPVMVLIVQQLAVVVLFAAGASTVLSSSGERARRWALRGLLAAGVVFLFALFSHGYWTGGFVGAAAPHVRATQNPDQQRMVARLAGEFLAKDVVQLSLVGLLLAGAVFAFVASRRMSATLLAALVLVLGAVDYYRVDRYILHPETFRGHDAYRLIRARAETSRYSAPDGMIDFLRRQEGPFRIFPMDGPERPFSAFFASNRFMVFDIASIGGYHPAKLSLYDEFLRDALMPSLANGNFDLLNMLNVRYIVSGERLPEHPLLKAVWTGRDFEQQPRAVYLNAGAFPRAWVTGAYRVASREETPTLLAAGDVDLRHTVLLDRKPAIEPEPGDSAIVSVTGSSARETKLAVELDRPGLVVLSEIYYPDWKATVDGAPAEVLRANHILRAVAVGAGRHEVVYHYDASLLHESAALSVGAFALTLLVLAGALTARWKGAPWKRSS